MAKFFTHTNLLIMCWTVALLHLTQSLLRHILRDTDNTPLLTLETIFFVITILAAIGYYLINHPKIRISFDLILLIIMFIWLIISCLVQNFTTGEDFFVMNSSPMNDLEIIIIVYLLGRHSAVNGLHKWVSLILKAILTIVTIIMLYILYSVFTNTYFITPNNGYIGMLNGTHFQINCNRNFVGAGAMTVSLICFCLILVSKIKAQKIIYSVFFVIHYFALILSCSRTGILAALVGFTVIVGIVSYLHFDKTNNPLRILYSSICALISGVVFFLLRYPVFSLYSTIVTDSNGIDLGAREIIDASTISMTSRTTIWKYCLEIIFSPRYILTGTTPGGSADVLLEVSNNTLEHAHAHNQILQVGISLGLPAMIVFIVLLILIALKCLKVLFGRDYTMGIKLMPCLILAIMLDNMAERYCMFYQYFISYVFFFLCGYVVACKPQLKSDTPQ